MTEKMTMQALVFIMRQWTRLRGLRSLLGEKRPQTSCASVFLKWI